METRISRQDIGRGIAQPHLRLGTLSAAVEQLAAPAPAPGSASLTLLLSPSSNVDDRALQGNALWLVRLVGGDAMQMPMRRVRLADGRLGFGRLPAGAYEVIATPYGVVAGSRQEGLDARATFTAEEHDSLTLPVPVRACGTLCITARSPPGRRLEARVAALGADGGSRSLRFEWVGAGHGPLTHATAHSIIAPPLPPGPTTLRFTCEGYAQRGVEVVVLEGEVTDLDVILLAQ
ncbi:MAG: hypothetical protein R3F49_24055 [Planctomycetota bacterium]